MTSARTDHDTAPGPCGSETPEHPGKNGFSQGEAVDDPALSEAATAAAARPRDAGALGHFGFLLLQRGELDRAEAAFLRARDVAPANASVLLGLSHLRLRQGRPDEALASAAQAARDADSFHAQAHYGHLLAADGQHGRAEAAFRAAIRLDQTDVGIHLALSRVLAARNRPAAALEEADRACALAPDDDSATAHRAALQASANPPAAPAPMEADAAVTVAGEPVIQPELAPVGRAREAAAAAPRASRTGATQARKSSWRGLLGL